MNETTNHEEDDSTAEQSSESFLSEAGGTSVSFRPGSTRFLPESERRPWWVAPGAIVLIPLGVMLLAAWAIPDRIGSEAREHGSKFPAFGETRSSPSRESSDEEQLDPPRNAAPSYASSSSGSRRAPREGAVRPPRRGFSPVREREESPVLAVPIPDPPPQVIAPAPPPEPLIARSNGARAGEALSVARRPDEPEPGLASEPEVVPEPGSAEEGTPEANAEAASTPPERDGD